jgi:hypothetical protein
VPEQDPTATAAARKTAANIGLRTIMALTEKGPKSSRDVFVGLIREAIGRSTPAQQQYENDRTHHRQDEKQWNQWRELNISHSPDSDRSTVVT